MNPTAKTASSERDQTDESLRAERDKADHALEVELAAIDDTADAVISRARNRADAVLAAARAKTDGQIRTAPLTPSPRTLAHERAVEDATLRDERATADETVREERAEKVSLLSAEREETDKDLSNERARSDDLVATRDDFLGIVSHDLRNMLAAMVGRAALISLEVARPDHAEQVRDHAARIQRAGARMERLIGDLVDVASIDAGVLAVRREISDPVHVLTEAVETFQEQAKKNGITLGAQMSVPLPRTAYDPARILQVLTNLLSNALKFTAADGTVTVAVEHLGNDLRFAVRDTGIGIPADQLETVFGRFLQVTRNDRRGVGLGLYISKCIVQGHGGRIWAESELGKGTTFYFTLPVEAAG
jgi:signal transduction histidine kinase